MSIEIKTLNRMLVLSDYRAQRASGLAPVAAMQRVREAAATLTARALAGGRDYAASIFAADYLAADHYVADIFDRCEQSPFWLTGKVTYMPAALDVHPDAPLGTIDNPVKISATEGPWANMITAQNAARELHREKCPGAWIDWSESGAPDGMAHCTTCDEWFTIWTTEDAR